MRTYHLTSSLVSLCLLLGSCTLGSIDPDIIDIADQGTDEIGDADEAADETDDLGGDGDGDTGESGISTEGTTGSESTTEDTGDSTDDGTGTSDASDTSDTSDTTDTTGSDACFDVPVMGECTTCLVDNCCDQVLDCLADDVCDCYYQCWLEGQDCGDQCGPPTEAVMNLGQCAELNDCQSCL